MRRTAFALLSACLFVSLALFGGPAQAGGYGGGFVVGGYVGDGYVGGGAYYGPGPRWGGSGCCCGWARRGLFTSCGGYYPHPAVRYYAPPPVYYREPPPPPVYYREPPPPPVYYHEAHRRCPLVPRLDGRGGWVWAPDVACD